MKHKLLSLFILLSVTVLAQDDVEFQGTDEGDEASVQRHPSSIPDHSQTHMSEMGEEGSHNAPEVFQAGEQYIDGGADYMEQVDDVVEELE